MIITDILVSSLSGTIEIMASVSVRGVGGGSVRAVNTDAPSDLELGWDPDLLSSDTVDIEVIRVGSEDGNLGFAGYLATGVSNDRSRAVEPSVLPSIDVPGDSLVVIMVNRKSGHMHLPSKSVVRFSSQSRLTIPSTDI